jgi:hypothetical protein
MIQDEVQWQAFVFKVLNPLVSVQSEFVMNSLSAMDKRQDAFIRVSLTLTLRL